MKIATLGISKSGKSTYTCGMAMEFYHADANVDMYHIQDRKNTGEEEYSGYEYRAFEDLNTMITNREFPPSTSTTTRMRLDFCKDEKKIIPIDWIDYRGGVLKEFARGEIQEKDKQLYKDLLNSSVIIVFTDAAFLKALMIKGADHKTIAPYIGATDISQVLHIVKDYRKSKGLRTRVMFILTKCDSTNIDIESDFPALKNMLEKVYSLTISHNKDYEIYPVGVVGIGNVTTKVTYNTEDIPQIEHEIKKQLKVRTYNITSSFAQVLLMAMDTAITTCVERRNKRFDKMEKIDKRSATILGKIRAIWSDLLLVFSGKLNEEREAMAEIVKLNHEIENLKEHRESLKKIANERR